MHMTDQLDANYCTTSTVDSMLTLPLGNAE